MTNAKNQNLWPIITLAIAGMALTAFFLWVTEDALMSLAALSIATSAVIPIFVFRRRTD